MWSATTMSGSCSSVSLPAACRQFHSVPRPIRQPLKSRTVAAAAGDKSWIPVSRCAEAGLLAALAAVTLTFAPPATASLVRLPPIDRDPNRCERAFTGNTIGQANAVSDKLLDLRSCNLSGGNFKAVVLSGALMVDADFSNSNMQEAVLTKAYAKNADLSGTDMTNAVIDRVTFDGANLSKVKFINAVITGTTFEGANLDGADFEDALIGGEDVKRLCLNPTLTGESRVGVGCRYN